MKFKYLLLAGILLNTLNFGQALGQSAVIRGEYTPGNYKNIKATEDGALIISSSQGSVTWLTSAARTTTQTLTINQSYAKGIIVFCNVTAVPTVETLVVSITQVDVLSNATSVQAANTARATTGTIILKLYPGLTPIAASTGGHVVTDILTYKTRLTVTHSASGSFTYSCTYQLLT